VRVLPGSAEPTDVSTAQALAEGKDASQQE
jgi:hypothetical protein